MIEMPVTGPYADYRGRRYLVLFGGPDWTALRAELADDIPDAFARGELGAGPGAGQHWAKVPDSVLGDVIDIDVTATLAGHKVSVRGQLPDGRVRVWFVGSPAVAREIGLDGDQQMGWSGVVASDALRDIRVTETPRV